MAYLKFSADKIFDGYNFLEKKVLITDEPGIIKELIEIDNAGDDVQYLKGILSPGFINCHCHLELSHMRGLIPQKTGLVDFVFKVVSQRHFAEQEIVEAIDKAEKEMIDNGIVAVGDICNTAFTAAKKKEADLCYYNFIEVSGWLPAVAEIRINTALGAKGNFDKISFFSQQHAAVVPHAPYSVSQELWDLIRPFYQNKTVSIHNQETIFEDELFIRGSGDFMRMYGMMKIDTSHFLPSGRSSLRSYFAKLKGAKNVMLVHNTFTKEEDIIYSKKIALENNQQLFFCLCPNANLYIEDAVPPLQVMEKNNCNIVLGTDSLASNNTLSVLEEIKTLRKHYVEFPVVKLLQAATINGANALSMNATLGSFEKGKKPGVILLSNDLNEVKRLV